MIQNFVVQPYPLFAIVIVAGRSEPHVGRVVGWVRIDDGPASALGPVLTLGARTFVTGVADHVAYLSPLTLQAWDIGLRPLSPPLIKMVKLLSESDRAAIKTEWMEVCRPFLAELLTLDAQSSGQGGYHFFCLEKI